MEFNRAFSWVWRCGLRETGGFKSTNNYRKDLSDGAGKNAIAEVSIRNDERSAIDGGISIPIAEVPFGFAVNSPCLALFLAALARPRDIAQTPIDVGSTIPPASVIACTVGSTW
jgi:hypothetical protein